MMRIESITDKELSDFFLMDPNLIVLGLPDSSVNSLYLHKQLVKLPQTQLYGVYFNDELVLTFAFEMLTDITASIHVHLKSEYHQSGLYSEIVPLLKEYFKDSQLYKVVAFAPEPCKHVHAACEKYGFKKEGLLTDAIMWRNERVDLTIYSLTLK